MLLAVLLIPALVAMAMLNSMPAHRVLVKLFVPCLMFIPLYMTSPVGGFHLDALTLVVILLCGVGLVRWHHTLTFTFVDACILLLAFSAFYADAHQRAMNIAIYALCQNLNACAFPYFVGRTLIEQTGSRREFAKSLVLCLAFIGVVSLYEYRMEFNVFVDMVGRLTGAPSGMDLQTRWGFARIAGPFTGAIQAGMVFSVGLLLQLWLSGTKSWEDSKVLRFFRADRRAKAVTAGVVLGLFLTQSRGPWIGCVFGLIVASIGFARDRRRATTFAIALLVVALVVAGIGLKKYAFDQAYTYGDGGDQDQQNAAYRADMIPIYLPLIAEGGLWGWGTPSVMFRGQVGYVAGLTSIDNEYLRMGMAQGYFGVTVFVLILIASIYRAARFCASFRNRQDIMLAFCLLGALLALSFSIATVALLAPMAHIAFLLIGWTQSLRPTDSQEAVLPPAATGPFTFKKVFA